MSPPVVGPGSLPPGPSAAPVQEVRRPREINIPIMIEGDDDAKNDRQVSFLKLV